MLNKKVRSIDPTQVFRGGKFLKTLPDMLNAAVSLNI